MIDIQWKGKIGYGDIVSPICYAHNISYKLQTEVRLSFRWENGYGRKIEVHDPEQLWVRANYIFTKCIKEKTNVVLFHRFHNPLDINHTNYDWGCVSDDPFHNYWRSIEQRNPRKGLIVLNSTLNNVLTLKQYGKPWKDPVNEKWHDIITTAQKKGNVVLTDYRTPISDLFKILNEAEYFIGYHGAVAWIARFLQVPSIIFTSSSITKTALPDAIIKRKYEGADNLFDNIDQDIEQAKIKIDQNNELYKSYSPSTKLLGSLTHDL